MNRFTHISRVRWFIADVLSRIACWLRGQEWYIGNAWASAPGNRASDLKQSVWERCVALNACSENKDQAWLDSIESELNELGQLAGENWGHIQP